MKLVFLLEERCQSYGKRVQVLIPCHELDAWY